MCKWLWTCICILHGHHVVGDSAVYVIEWVLYLLRKRAGFARVLTLPHCFGFCCRLLSFVEPKQTPKGSTVVQCGYCSMLESFRLVLFPQQRGQRNAHFSKTDFSETAAWRLPPSDGASRFRVHDESEKAPPWSWCLLRENAKSLRRCLAAVQRPFLNETRKTTDVCLYEGLQPHETVFQQLSNLHRRPSRRKTSSFELKSFKSFK